MRELLDALERPVELLVAHGPEETPLPGARDVDFGAETERIVEGIAALSERVTFRVEDEPPGFERYPAIALLPDGEDVGVRYYGLPWGYEVDIPATSDCALEGPVQGQTFAQWAKLGFRRSDEVPRTGNQR